jgi:hypothetical protein
MPPQKELAEAFPVLLGQWSIVGFLSWQLMQQLRRTGKSDEKALLRG